MKDTSRPTGPWTGAEIERERRARAAIVRANARRGIEANFKDASAGARFAERFADAFRTRT